MALPTGGWKTQEKAEGKKEASCPFGARGDGLTLPGGVEVLILWVIEPIGESPDEAMPPVPSGSTARALHIRAGLQRGVPTEMESSPR